MSIASNKICVTERGLEFLNESKQEFVERNSKIKACSTLQTQTMSRATSLPLLKNAKLLKQPGLMKKLSSMSNTKLKLQKIGLKRINQKKQDKNIQKKLNQQLQGYSSYVKSIIPNLVKMTKQNHHNIQFQTRFQRARMYVSRLQHNFDSKFVFKPKPRHEETI